jgi:hypothetical protein
MPSWDWELAVVYQLASHKQYEYPVSKLSNIHWPPSCCTLHIINSNLVAVIPYKERRL